MIKKIFILSGVIFCMAVSSCSNEVQKQMRPLRDLVKNKKGGDAVKMFDNLRKDSALALEPKLFDLGKEAQILVNDEENEKNYLKKSYDTLRFFNSTYGIYENILKCDDLEQKRWAGSGVKMKYRKNNAEVAHFYYSNLCAGGRFLYSKKKYNDVTKFMQMALDVPMLPIWGNDRSVTQTENYVNNAYLHFRSAYFSKDYANVERYKNVVMRDSAFHYDALEMLTLSSGALGDTVKYIDYLKQGLREFPSSPFFFSRLTDYMTGHQNYRKALSLADSMLTVDSQNVLFLVSKSVALLNLQRNVEAIEVAQRILEIDSSIVAPLYYIGAAYCNLANNLKMPTNINSLAYKTVAEKKKYYYTEARPYLERYRQAEPEETKRWAPLLYRVYLSLNMGKKFAEMELILQGY